ncbi:hypothetical protein L3081_07215 [Colwellia sp. MSW7]|uniref:Uncharacterized protein n=1 Tax=Colwellia maritima TaxID=2912588 RepID=A0ABS9WZ16_9GAMM|nr:hypothetical protein [Colwellia maritima]MCI2283221.1 hypothetical protein [Colwellia maritima]
MNIKNIVSPISNIPESERVSAEILRKYMRGLVLDSDSLIVSFERSCQSPPKSDFKQKDRQREERLSPSILPLCE